MKKTSRPEADGYAVEVSLLKLKPRSLVLAAMCFVILAATLGWLGGGAGELAVSQTVANHAANTERREQPSPVPNNATSQPARVDDKNAASTPSQPSADADAEVPGPSPAGFAENNASNAAPAASPAVSEVAQTAAAPAQSAAPAAPTTAATTTPTGGGFAVQAGSFNSVSEANERVSALRAAGFEARTAAVEIAGRGTWHRVYTGLFATREEAAAHDKKLRASGAVAATIITPVQD